MGFRIPAVVCAGGHGKVMRPGKSKLGDVIGSKPLIARVLDNIKEAGCFGPVYVVINPLIGDELRSILEDCGHRGLRFVYQSERRGAANAVHKALPLLRDTCIGHFMAMFGEMPFVSPQTLREVAQAHCKNWPDITFLGVPYEPGHVLGPALSCYTYLKDGWCGHLANTNFLRMYHPDKPVAGDLVLGSVYCFKTEWFTTSYSSINALDTKNDGHGPEFHLPPLIQTALHNGSLYNCVLRNIPEQILGINTVDDYNLAAQVDRGFAKDAAA